MDSPEAAAQDAANSTIVNMRGGDALSIAALNGELAAWQWRWNHLPTLLARARELAEAQKAAAPAADPEAPPAAPPARRAPRPGK